MTRVGMWYGSGPADRDFVEGDMEFNVHRVVSDESGTLGCVLIENGGGQRFPVPESLIDEVASR
jgi:hypothetical protein